MKTLIRPVILLCAVAICATGAYLLWRTTTVGHPPSHTRKVLYYQDSMHPWIKSDQPGKCTICAMDLTPILDGESGYGLRDGTVVLSSNSVTVLNVQTEEVRRQSLSRTLRVAGTLEPNEAQKTIISAPSPGRIQSSAVEFPGVEVEKGQMLITLFSPELVQRRAFLRTVGGDQSSVGKGLVQATKGSDPYLGEIVAPQSGLVVERNVYPGQYVVEGEKLFTLVDASVLWFRFDAYEQQLPWLELGQTMEVTTAAAPGRSLPAVISFIEPTLNDATRTVKVRADIKNPVVTTNGRPQRLLRFGTYAEGRVRTEIPNVLAVPRTAILFPGGAAYAYVSSENGAYERRRVKLGLQGDGLWEVLGGLEEGERVVTSGNVLIDAQAQFNQGSKPDDMAAGDMAAAEPEAMPVVVGVAVSHATAAVSPHAMTFPNGALKASQQKALTEFLAVADGISRALAADSLDQLKTHTGALPGVVASLAKELGDDHPWHAPLKRIQGTSSWPAPADLAAARKTFLPFSTNVVELVQLVRGKEAAFRSLKVYHCPMAPKPGLWFQAKGPLRNPFYGADMLTCGEEVRVVAVVPGLTAAKAPLPVTVSPDREAMSKLPLTNSPPLARTKSPTNSAAVMSEEPPSVARTRQPAAAGMATNSPPAMERAEHPSVNHSRAVGDAMSPGAERQTIRREAILKGLAADAAAAGKTMGKDGQEDPAAPGAVTPEMQRAARQQQALKAFVDVADGTGQALAGDNLTRYYECITALPTVFTLLRQDFGTNHPLNDLIQKAITAGLPLSSAGQWRTTKNLAEARALFLPFSTATVDLAKALQKEGEPFASLKIYQCPKVSQPGLWMQTKGPLRNPFHGATNLTCCVEVKL